MSVIAFFRDDDGTTYPIEVSAGCFIKMSGFKDIPRPTFDRSVIEKMTVNQLHLMLYNMGLSMNTSARKNSIIDMIEKKWSMIVERANALPTSRDVASSSSSTTGVDAEPKPEGDDEIEKEEALFAVVETSETGVVEEWTDDNEKILSMLQQLASRGICLNTHEKWELEAKKARVLSKTVEVNGIKYKQVGGDETEPYTLFINVEFRAFDVCLVFFYNKTTDGTTLFQALEKFSPDFN